MQLFTTTYRTNAGWSVPLAPVQSAEQTLILAFGAPELAADPRPFLDLASAYPGAALVGCSTAGEIAGSQVNDATLSVAVATFKHTQLHVACTEVRGPDDSGPAGERLAAMLPRSGLRAVFMLCGGTSVNGTPLVAALTAQLPSSVAVSGGLAGDAQRFMSTWVLVDGQPRTGQVCAVGLYGERLQVGQGCDGGWMDFGPQRRITRAKGNVLYELDGKPALDLYKTYLGELASGLPGTALRYPMSVRQPGSTGKARVRTILSIDEAQRSLTFAGDMPVGHEARLMRSTSEGLIGSAAAAVAQATQGLTLNGAPLVVSVSCVGRRMMLGERTEEEVETIADGVPAGAGHVGFYSYGEIARLHRDGPCELHNQTMTVTVYCEV